MKPWRLIEGDCLEAMAALDACSVDAIVCDPPYELGFMGKGWDSAGVSFKPETWAAALRVAKPGAHLVAFGGTRTYHRIACAIEDAGWEIRDCLSWLYGSGFPKSLDVSKAIDRAAGAATDAARQWQGWGTALKPAWEPIILARKPLIGTVAANVQEHGTGALNVDGCRIGVETRFNAPASPRPGTFNASPGSGLDYRGATAVGRWPANVALDEEAAALLDAQGGERTSGSRAAGNYGRLGFNGWESGPMPQIDGDSGGASRFFYTAKASRSEREIGLEGMPESHPIGGADKWTEQDRRKGEGVTRKAAANVHPTVKPVELMRWLVRLVTPPGGTVLDPFTGSGTTLIAALREGFSCIGIEREPQYVQIARRRIEGDSPLFNREAV